MSEPPDQKVVQLNTEKASSVEFSDDIRASENMRLRWQKSENDKAITLAKIQTDHASNTHRSNLGWLGKFLGSDAEKSGNVASLAILFCFAFLFIAFFKLDMKDQSEPFFKIMTAGLGIISLALGYLFGSGAKK